MLKNHTKINFKDDFLCKKKYSRQPSSFSEVQRCFSLVVL
jgi:hypothetical protein